MNKESRLARVFEPHHLFYSRQWNAPAWSRSQQRPDRPELPPIPTCWSQTPPDEHDATPMAATTETVAVTAPTASRRTVTVTETLYRWCHQDTRGCRITMSQKNPSKPHSSKRDTQMVRLQDRNSSKLSQKFLWFLTPVLWILLHFCRVRAEAGESDLHQAHDRLRPGRQGRHTTGRRPYSKGNNI